MSFFGGVDGGLTTLTSDYTLQIGDGGLVIGQPGSPFIVNLPDGFGIPTVRNGDNPRPSDVGSYFGRDFIGPRFITIDVTVRGDTGAEAMANWRQLLGAWQLATPDGSASMPLKVLFPGGPIFRINGRPRDAAPDFTNLHAGLIPASILFAAADPRIYDDDLSSVTVGLADVGSGRTYPRTYPLTYGSGSSGGLIQALNDGNYSTPSVAEIVGPCVNPIIEIPATGETMQCILTVGPTDSLVIDFGERTIKLNGQGRYSAKTVASTFWQLPPGTTEVHFNANAFVLGATCTLSWRSASMN